MICLYLISYSIEHVLLFEGYLLGLSLRVCASFPSGIFAPWVAFVMQLEGWKFFVRVLSFVRSFVSWIRVVVYYRYESWVTSVRSPNQCFLYYFIMGDMIYLCCIDMRCSSFLFTFSLPSFDFPSFISYYLFIFFLPFQHLYTFPIRHLSSHCLHDPLMAWAFFFRFTIDITIDSS